MTIPPSIIECPPRRPQPRRVGVPLLLLVPLLIVLGGCGPYVLEGRVVRGDFGAIDIVDPDDVRLSDPGLGGVSVEAIKDPMSLGRKTIATATSQGDGSIRLVISDFGAGFLEDDWELRATRQGEEFAASIMRLPYDVSSRRLLVLIRPDAGRKRNSLATEAEKQLQGGDLQIPKDSSIFR